MCEDNIKMDAKDAYIESLVHVKLALMESWYASLSSIELIVSIQVQSQLLLCVIPHHDHTQPLPPLSLKEFQVPIG